VLLMCCQCVANLLPMCCQCVSNVLLTETLAWEQAEAASAEGASSSASVAGKRRRGYDAGSVAASKRASVSAIGMR